MSATPDPCPVCLCGLGSPPGLTPSGGGGGGASASPLAGLTATCNACRKGFHLACLQAAAAGGGAGTCPMCRAVWQHPPAAPGPKPRAHAPPTPGPGLFGGFGGGHAAPGPFGAAQGAPLFAAPSFGAAPAFNNGAFGVPPSPANLFGGGFAGVPYSAAGEAPPPAAEVGPDDPVATPAQAHASDPAMGTFAASPPPACTLRVTAEAEAVGPAACASFTAHVRVTAPAAAAAHHAGASAPPRHRLAADLVAAVDVSGSMAGAKLAEVRATLLHAIAELHDDDRLALVSFDHTASRLTPLVRCTPAGRQRLRAAALALEDAGGTNLAAGLNAALEAVTSRTGPRNPVTGVLFLSDGCDNAGGSRGALAAAAARGARGGGGAIHVFGYGRDHDAATLSSMAEAGRGAFTYVATPAQARPAFAAVLAALLSVAAQGVQLRLRALNGAAITAVHAGHGAAAQPDGAHVVDIGTLSADEARDILLDMQLPAAPIVTDNAGNVMNGAAPAVPYLSVELLALPAGACDTSASPVRVAAAELAVLRPAQCPPARGDGQMTSAALDIERQRLRLLTASALEAAAQAASRRDAPAASAALDAAQARIEASPAACDGLAVALREELRSHAALCTAEQVLAPAGSAALFSSAQTHRMQHASGTPSPASALYATPAMTLALHRASGPTTL